jgi:hypothetical protein
MIQYHNTMVHKGITERSTPEVGLSADHVKKPGFVGARQG